MLNDYFRFMFQLVKALLGYRSILFERLFRFSRTTKEDTLGNQFGIAPKRLKQYLMMMDLISIWAQSMKGKIDFEENQVLLLDLACFIPLYDDFTDDDGLSYQEIVSILEGNESNDKKKRQVQELYRSIVNNHPNPKEFKKLLKAGGRAQDDSMEQKMAGVSRSKLAQITADKGGYFTQLCFSIFYKELEEWQSEIIFDLGELIQLLNDIFDVHKDVHEGIQTLPNTSESIQELEYLYKEKVANWFELLEKNYSKELVIDLKRMFSIIFATGIICIDQFKRIEKKYGEFNPKSLSRKELICDMDSIRQVMRTLRIANSLINV